eukprot:362121-Chlamydomonas_euryale.AAC.5
MRRLDLSDNPGMGSAGAEALAVRALAVAGCALVEVRLERCGVTASGRLALASALQANARSAMRHLHLHGNVDPDADPKAGARLVGTPRGDEVAGAASAAAAAREAAGSGRPHSGVVVAGMHPSELMLAQALRIGRHLRTGRGVHIHG